MKSFSDAVKMAGINSPEWQGFNSTLGSSRSDHLLRRGEKEIAKTSLLVYDPGNNENTEASCVFRPPVLPYLLQPLLCYLQLSHLVAVLGGLRISCR